MVGASLKDLIEQKKIDKKERNSGKNSKRENTSLIEKILAGCEDLDEDD